MSWETTDVLSADTTDVVSADTTDVLSADTTDVLSADTSNSGNATTWFCQIWHPQNGNRSPFGHIGRSPSENRRSGTHSKRLRQPWWSQALGTPLFLGKQGYVGSLFPKTIGPFFKRGGGEGGWDLQKMRPDPGFRKDFPHYWALPVQCREGWGPLV